MGRVEVKGSCRGYNPASQGGRSWYCSWEALTCTILQSPLVFKHTVLNSAPAQSEESAVPANSLAVSQSSSLRSHHSNLTFPSQGSSFCILAWNNSQFRLTQQNFSLLQGIEAEMSWRGKRETEQVIPGH